MLSSVKPKVFFNSFIIFISTITLSSLPSNVTAESPPDWRAEITAAATKDMKTNNTPSIQIAVAHDGKVIFENAYGLADLENKVIATSQTRYRIASISKWFTATAAMMLVEQGKLDLEKRVQFYCDEYPEKDWPITTRHLLTHTSGIPHYRDFHNEIDNAQTQSAKLAIERQRDRAALGRYTRYTQVTPPLENFKDNQLMFKPGSEWQYTSHGYRLLGCVLEGAAKHSYNDIVQELIFDPVGLKNTLQDDAWAIVPGRASGYRLSRSNPIRRADMRDISENLPAGGHLSTATDLVKFAQAFQRYSLVSEKNVSLMSSQYINSDIKPKLPAWRYAIPNKFNYGYGVMLFPLENSNWIGHTGQQPGASSIVISVPEKKLSIAVLTNVKGWRGYISFMKQIENIVSKGLSLEQE